MARYASTMLSALIFLTAASAAPTINFGSLAARPTLPSSTLPPPDPSTSLKYIALGVGTQNYTCATSDGTSVPASGGAMANLYDATPLMSVPILGNYEINTQTCKADQTNSGLAQRQIGVHYFDAALVPSFDLSLGTQSLQYPQGLYLSAKKSSSVAAPSNSCTGRNGAAAVAWVMLDDRGDGLTRGLSRAYRVHTTGGSAPATCAGMPPTFTVDYAAEYWFYG